MFAKNNKKICFTLDLEQDYGRINEYSSFRNINSLISLFKKYSLSLTIFTVGKIIEDYPKIIEIFAKNLDCDFQLHSYAHQINKKLSSQEKKDDFYKGIRAYQNFFDRKPKGYRAPCGNIRLEEIQWLKDEEFLYSSSFIPTYRPKLFNNLKFSGEPFYYPNGLLEIPLSSLSLMKIPYLQIPYSLSYFQLLGWPLTKLLIKTAGMPPLLIFGFHLHNLSRLDNFKQLKPGFRIFYSRNQNNGLEILEKFIKMVHSDYKTITISEVKNTFFTRNF